MHTKIPTFAIWIFCVVLFLIPWLRFDGTFWPIIVSTKIGHCPLQNCDFLNHYLPQIQRISQGDFELQEGWYYPPTLALLFQFLASFSVEQASVFWTGFNLIGMFLLIRLGYTIVSSQSVALRIMIATTIVSTSFPVLSSIKWGQISLWLTVLCWYAFCNAPKKSPTTGFLIGIAGASKIYPMFYLVYPLLQKQMSSVLYAILGFFLLGLLFPILLLGWEQTLVYYETSFLAGSFIQSIAPLRGGQALAPLFHRWFIDGQHMNPSSLPPLFFSLSSPLFQFLFVLNIIILSTLSIRQMIQKTQLSLPILFCWLGLLSPPGWQHYFCYLPLCHIQLFQYAQKHSVLLLLFLSIIIERIPVLLLDRVDGIYYTCSAYGTTGLSTLLLLCALLYQSHSMTKSHDS